MEKELLNSDKELLLKDLCARLPYSVKVFTLFENKEVNGLLEAVYPEDDRIIISNLSRPCHYPKQDCGGFIIEENECKPYLFPLSSMTEEQKEEYNSVCNKDLDALSEAVCNRTYVKTRIAMPLYYGIDWLIANHFDYRGLIEKGLAIDATGLNIYN